MEISFRKMSGYDPDDGFRGIGEKPTGDTLYDRLFREKFGVFDVNLTIEHLGAVKSIR